MPLPPHCRVRNCMGCIPLQRGCIILGCLGMVGSLIEVGTHLQWLVDFELSVKQCRKKEATGTPLIGGGEDVSLSVEKNDFANMLEDLEDKDNRKDKCPSDSFVSLVRFILGFASFTYFIYFIMTIMMIYGVCKKRPKMMTPWMVWEIAQIFFSVLALLGLGHGTTPLRVSSFIEVVLMVYFILVVASYYLELKEAEDRRDGVTVMAVTHTPHEMMVVIPTQPKDDPPPPYPGFTSAYNPAYNPTGTGYDPTGTGYNPTGIGFQPVCSPSHTGILPPPQYQASIVPQFNQTSHEPIPGSPALYSNLNTPTNVSSDGNSEAAPLVEKPPLPTN